MPGKMPNVAAGERHGSRVAIREVDRNPATRRRNALLRCDCGREEVVDLSGWRRGLCNQCPDCRSKVSVAAKKDLHGWSKTAEYRSWYSAKRRCYEKSFCKYPTYGGRGITMADEWINDFPKFIAFVGPKPTPRHTLDRIDNDAGYVPGNVRWATPKEQRANQRRRTDV